MKIAGQLQWTDYLKAQFLNMRPNGLTGIAAYGFFGLLLLWMITGTLPTVAREGLGASWVFLLPIVTVVIFIPLYYYVLLPRRVRHIYEQHKEMSAPFEHEITTEGLVSSNQYGYANRPWGNFRKWTQNKNLLMLYLSDIQFILIPKRFCTPEQLEAILARLRENRVPEGNRLSRGRLIAMGIFLLLFIFIGIMLYMGFQNDVR